MYSKERGPGPELSRERTKSLQKKSIQLVFLVVIWFDNIGFATTLEEGKKKELSNLSH